MQQLGVRAFCTEGKVSRKVLRRDPARHVEEQEEGWSGCTLGGKGHKQERKPGREGRAMESRPFGPQVMGSI